MSGGGQKDSSVKPPDSCSSECACANTADIRDRLEIEKRGTGQSTVVKLRRNERLSLSTVAALATLEQRTIRIERPLSVAIEIFPESADTFSDEQLP
ncbi:MAG: hypothetical protein KDD69_01385 [Bdellovibrionales bacterium]|nr:hypothetical protein [Bdellovibrionales bacterium]